MPQNGYNGASECAKPDLDLCSCQFSRLGTRLMKAAEQQDKALVTVQVGGMDGKSNDPMNKMVMALPSARQWLPIVIEPVPQNFATLEKHYATLQSDKGIICSLPERRAISYDGSDTCTFCHFNLSDTADPHCQKQPNWMKLQIGTLICDDSRAFFGKDFDLCIVQAPLDCGPVSNVLRKWGLPDSALSMLQVDVESYEAVLIPAFLKSTPASSLPPVLHFEHKVIGHKDKKRNTNGIDELLGVVKRHGYTLYNQGEDMLAVLLPPEAQLRASLSHMP
jgi:hypothetical protein